MFCGARGYSSAAMYPEQWDCSNPETSPDGYPHLDEFGHLLLGGGKYSRIFGLTGIGFWGVKIWVKYLSKL